MNEARAGVEKEEAPAVHEKWVRAEKAEVGEMHLIHLIHEVQ